MAKTTVSWYQIIDPATQRAIKQLQLAIDNAVASIDLSSAGGGIGLPIEMTDVTGLTAALAGKSDTGHTHAEADITGLVTDLAGKAAVSHTHAITDLSGGSDGDIIKIVGGVKTWTPASGGAGTPSVSVSISPTAGGTVNVSTLGTVDWFIMDVYRDPPRIQASKQIHSKIRGGWIKNSFEWTYGGYTNTFSNFIGGIGATMQSTAGDDIANGTNNSSLCPFAFTTGAAVPVSSSSSGWGFSFRVPACATSRTLVILFSHYSCKMRITAELSDGSASNSAVSDSLALTQVSRTATITYASAYPIDLVVRADMFDNYSGDPNWGFGCAYVA